MRHILLALVVHGPSQRLSFRHDGLPHSRSDLAPFLFELDRVLLVINPFPASTVVRNR